MASASAKKLARGLNTIRVRPDGTYHHRRSDLIVNWGNSHQPRWMSVQALQHMLNKPQNVAIASDKVLTFQQLPNHIPAWTTNREEACQWLVAPRKYGDLLNAVVCRTLTRANSGRGIVVARRPEEVVPAPLYTQYVPKVSEYRVHATVYRVFDVAQKKRRNGVERHDEDRYIRSWDNGWVFCRDDIEVPEEVKDVSLEVLAHLGLDFGAVDVGWHPRYGTTVYEVNTAPGMEGQTQQHYIETLRGFLGNS